MCYWFVVDRSIGLDAVAAVLGLQATTTWWHPLAIAIWIRQLAAQM